MLAKVVGVLLLVAGAILGLEFIGAVATGAVGFALVLLKAGLVAALIWWGWGLINRANALPKVLGTFVVVGGVLLAIPLFGLLVVEAFALVWMVAKTAVVAALLFGGWQLLKRDTHFTQRV